MQAFSQRVAEKYGVECRVDDLQIETAEGNLEARARQQRYALFEQALDSDEVIVTAHHLNDQAETFLLNLLRGSGAAGLRAIAATRPLGKGWLLRPLLQVARSEIEQYATDQKLEWVEDPSNEDLRFDRNFLRHRILPILESRWPSLLSRLDRVSRWQGEQHELITDLAAIDYATCRTDNRFSSHDCLKTPELTALSIARQKNVIRYWIEREGYPQLGVHRLQQLTRQVTAREDAQPEVEGNSYQVRRYGGQLFLVEKQGIDRRTEELTVPESGGLSINFSGEEHRVDREQILSRLKLKDNGQRLELRYRSSTGGPLASSQRHRCKRLFHRYRVPPWLRDEIPQIHVDGELRDLLLF
jgi:tRNA(Ile)-lysidine synthase